MFGPDLCGGDKHLHTILHNNGTNFKRKEGLNPGEIAPPNADELTRKSFLIIIFILIRFVYICTKS